MQKIYTDQTLLQVSHIKNLLDAANIPSELRNEYAAAGVGELAFVDAWPELWVAYEDVALSRKVIDEYLATSVDGQDWRCSCGEINGAAFYSCWSCQSDRPQ
ncbi:MAG: DUF2007 domain-containing protein [Pseudomonadota bacterium]